MFKHAFSSALAMCRSAVTAFAKQAYPVPNLAGIWRCIANSQVVSVDVYYQVFPDQNLQGQGTIVYAGTSQIYNVQGYGRWSVSPPEGMGGQWLIRFQLQPQNHAIFSVFARPTGDPNGLYNRFTNPQTGNTIETSCQRIG